MQGGVQVSIEQIIGSNIRGLRNKYRMSQEELASKMQVSSSTVKNWETNGAIWLEQAVKLATLFNSTIDDLLKP